MRPYVYCCESEILHRSHCKFISQSNRIIEYATLKLPLRHNLKPCPDCIKSEYNAAKRNRNRELINKFHAQYIYAKGSSVFHNAECKLALNANTLYGANSYFECLDLGLIPCKCCKPHNTDILPAQIPECRKGDIYIADIPITNSGHIQCGVRPVLVVSNNKANRYSPVITVIPLTSKTKKNPLPTHVLLKKYCGLRQESIALVEQITSINKSCLRNKIGSIKQTIAEALVNNAIRTQLDMA